MKLTKKERKALGKEMLDVLDHLKNAERLVAYLGRRYSQLRQEWHVSVNPEPKS
jgi:hypothetical protein